MGKEPDVLYEHEDSVNTDIVPKYKSTGTSSPNLNIRVGVHQKVVSVQIQHTVTFLKLYS